MKNEWFLNYYCPSNAFAWALALKWRIKLKSAIGRILVNTRNNEFRRFFSQFNKTQIIHEKKSY